MKLMNSFLLSLIISIKFANAQMPTWSYDAGPDSDTSMGKELIDITAAIPHFPEISDKIIGRSQKFRPAFGPIPWRMRLEENQVKILFIGQDGTHIAEAAGRPATAGFGGRAQDLANYFGVNEGAAFINTYAFTIKGQYGVFNTPYIMQKNGETNVEFANFVDNKFWLISQDLSSPIVKWRNSLIDWIIRNNKKSMKLIVTFGGAARDAVATYMISKGASVETYGLEDAAFIQMPETKSEFAGGNNTFASLVDRDGRDLYEKIIGRKIDYSNPKDQKLVEKSIKENLQLYLNEMVFTKGGPSKNGMINLAQLGGYNISRVYINGKNTRSMKGLRLDDGTEIENDILVIELPHPSSLSKTVMDASSYSEGTLLASKKVMNKVRALNKYAKEGWYIEPDLNKTNFYALGRDYEYGRSDIGPEFYDFGTPTNRMVSVSTARRMSGNPNVVIIGTRDSGNFSNSLVESLTNGKASINYNNDNLFLTRPKTMDLRYQYDRGPGESYAKIMKENLDLEKIFSVKEGMSFDKDGIDAFNIKTHSDVGDFGHYRGTFNNPKILVIADPHGYDDILTAKALTGSRGQLLQGFMNDLGIEDQYLVVKTVPFGMDGATQEEWQTVLRQTHQYRKKLIAEILKNSNVDIIIADGEYAQKEVAKFVRNTSIKIFHLDRAADAPNYGLKELAKVFNKIEDFKNVRFSFKMADIPRSHLSFYARIWEGTSGDRVITSRGIKYKGLAFAIVVPEWAYNQKANFSNTFQDEIDQMIKVLEDFQVPLPYESIPGYLHRLQRDPSLVFMQYLENWLKFVA